MGTESPCECELFLAAVVRTGAGRFVIATKERNLPPKRILAVSERADTGNCSDVGSPGEPYHAVVSNSDWHRVLGS